MISREALQKWYDKQYTQAHPPFGQQFDDYGDLIGRTWEEGEPYEKEDSKDGD